MVQKILNQSTIKKISVYWRNLKIIFINCETSLAITCSAKFFVTDAVAVDQEPTFTMTDTKRYVPVITFKLKIMKDYCNI